MDQTTAAPPREPVKSNLAVSVCHDTYTVADECGGRWWPSDEASEEIDASAEPEATALRICTEQPMRGEWVS